MKRIYHPSPLFGLSFLRTSPVEVEVIELDYERGVAVCDVPVAENSVINIIRKRDGSPLLRSLRREVLIADLTIPGVAE